MILYFFRKWDTQTVSHGTFQQSKFWLLITFIPVLSISNSFALILAGIIYLNSAQMTMTQSSNSQDILMPKIQKLQTHLNNNDVGLG